MKRFVAGKTIFSAGVLCILFALSAAAEEQKALRIGIAPTSPPIQFWERNKVTGLEADFAEELAKELGRKIEFVDLKFGDLIPSLLNKDIDIIMAGMSVTRIRSLQIAFTTPYMRIGQMPLVRLEDRNKFVLPFDVIMTDKKVGATENTTSQFLLVQEFPKAKKTFFSSQGAAVNALKKKKIDLLILDSPYILWLAMKNEGKLTSIPMNLTEENLAWALRKEDTAFLATLNGILEKWKATGQLDAMIKKRIPAFD